MKKKFSKISLLSLITFLLFSSGCQTVESNKSEGISNTQIELENLKDSLEQSGVLKKVDLSTDDIKMVEKEYDTALIHCYQEERDDCIEIIREENKIISNLKFSKIKFEIKQKEMNYEY